MTDTKLYDELSYWYIDRHGDITRRLVPMAYERMDAETAKQVRDELNTAIDVIEQD